LEGGWINTSSKIKGNPPAVWCEEEEKKTGSTSPQGGIERGVRDGDPHLVGTRRREQNRFPARGATKCSRGAGVKKRESGELVGEEGDPFQPLKRREGEPIGGWTLDFSFL